jgi:hypothetical protein
MFNRLIQTYTPCFWRSSESKLGFFGFNLANNHASATFILGSAVLCVRGFMMLAMDELPQEFGILRAVGAKPK